MPRGSHRVGMDEARTRQCDLNRRIIRANPPHVSCEDSDTGN